MASSQSTVNYYTERVARDVVYSDLDIRLIPHPDTGNISPLKEIDCVKRALINLLLTEPGEKPFEPTYGTPLHRMLFNLMDFNPGDVEETIRQACKKWEPRAVIKLINVKKYPDDHAIDVSITFTPINIPYGYTTTVALKRTI